MSWRYIFTEIEPLTITLIDQGLVQPSSEKFLPVADGNRYSDLHPDIMQRERNLRILNPKRGVSKQFVFTGLTEHHGRGASKSVRYRRKRIHQENKGF